MEMECILLTGERQFNIAATNAAKEISHIAEPRQAHRVTAGIPTALTARSMNPNVVPCVAETARRGAEADIETASTLYKFQ